MIINQMDASSKPSQNPIRADEEQENQDDELCKLMAIRLSFNVTLQMALRSAVELNIFEIIAENDEPGGFLSAENIAAKLPTKNPEAPILLDRMLSLLASHSVLACSIRTQEDGEAQRFYGLEPTSKSYLKNEEEGSLGALLLLIHHKIFMESWNHLNDAILEGGGALPFERAHGMNAFEYTERDPSFNQVFNQAMSTFTTLVMKKILDVYKGLDDVEVLVDVGGGTGANLNLLTSKYPHIKGINYDLPHVIAAAPSSSSGVEYVAGDMFENVPRGDAIFMKWILHDWNDDQCLKLLKNCYAGLPNSGKVIVVESILSENPDNSVVANIVHMVDLSMLAQIPGGKERTLKNFNTLAMKSGFSSCEVICRAYHFWVMEFHKKEME